MTFLYNEHFIVIILGWQVSGILSLGGNDNTTKLVLSVIVFSKNDSIRFQHKLVSWVIGDYDLSYIF